MKLTRRQLRRMIKEVAGNVGIGTSKKGPNWELLQGLKSSMAQAGNKNAEIYLVFEGILKARKWGLMQKLAKELLNTLQQFEQNNAGRYSPTSAFDTP